MKQVVQLDDAGYYVGLTIADESPLEPGIYLLPAGSIDTNPPIIPNGKMAKWVGNWEFEDIPTKETDDQPEPIELTYAQKRAMEYPSIADYLDGIVKNDQAQIDKYIADCLAVKAKYPKPE